MLYNSLTALINIALNVNYKNIKNIYNKSIYVGLNII